MPRVYVTRLMDDKGIVKDFRPKRLTGKWRYWSIRRRNLPLALYAELFDVNVAARKLRAQCLRVVLRSYSQTAYPQGRH